MTYVYWHWPEDDGWNYDELDADRWLLRHVGWVKVQVIGIDESPEMLAQARKRLPEADLRQADLRQIPLPDDAGTPSYVAWH